MAHGVHVPQQPTAIAPAAMMIGFSLRAAHWSATSVRGFSPPCRRALIRMGFEKQPGPGRGYRSHPGRVKRQWSISLSTLDTPCETCAAFLAMRVGAHRFKREQHPGRPTRLRVTQGDPGRPRATKLDPGRPNATRRDQGRPGATKGDPARPTRATQRDPCAHANAGGQQLGAIRALNSREGLVPIRQLGGVAAGRYPAPRQSAPDATRARGSIGALDRRARAALPAGLRMDRLVCLWFAGLHQAATLDRLLSWPSIGVWPTIARSIPVLEPSLSSSQSCPRAILVLEDCQASHAADALTASVGRECHPTLSAEW